MKISAVIITLNEEQNLARCLASVRPLADEIVVVDSGSTDGTRAVAETFGARWVMETWRGYTEQKNFALAQAQYDWVLSVDADEEISPELQASLVAVKNGGHGPPLRVGGYRVSRVVCYRGKWIYHGDWYPDYLVRLFRRDAARFAGGTVHERLEIQGGVKACPLLPGELRHFTYRDAGDRNRRIEKYATLWAKMAQAAGKRAKPWDAVLHGATRLLRGYIWRGGFWDGELGWEIAWGNAREVYLKYQQLAELNR
jgi:glycosyltransferase involved in cell wall biosynthesis